VKFGRNKLKPTMNEAQKNIVARGDDNPPRRGTFLTPLLTNSQFDDPTGSAVRGTRPEIADQLVNGVKSATQMANIPSDEKDDVGRFDLRNFARGADRTGGTSRIK